MLKYFVVLPFVLLFVSCNHDSVDVEAVNGTIVCPDIQLNSLSSMSLSGEWVFFPDTIVSPQKIEDARASIPNFLINIPHKTHDLEGATHGTYLLNISGIESDDEFLLDVFTIYTASSIFINGEKIGSNGVVGASKYSSVPNWYIEQKPFFVHGDLQIVIQFSNFHKEKSGIINKIRLCGEEYCSRSTVWRMVLDFIILGCVLFIFIVQMLSFFGSNREKLVLYLALTAASFFAYLFFLTFFQIKKVYTGFELDYTVSLIYWRTSLALIIAFFASYVHLLYPKLFTKKIKNIVGVYSTFTIAVNLFLPYSIGNFNAIVFRYFILVLALLIAVVAVVAAIRRYSYARVFLIGFMIFMITAINDLLLNMDIINTINIAGVGVLGLMLVNLHLNNYRLNNALKKSRILAKELTELNSNLEQIVKDRTKDLEKSRVEAESANKTKSVFLSSISHEIRTPLNAIIGFSDLMKTTDLDEEQSEFVTNIINAGLILHDLINNVLDISKIEAGKLNLNESKFSFINLIQHVSNVFDLKVKEKQLKFEAHIDSKLNKYYIGDKLRLSQILMNLVGNAIKFTDKGTVTLKVMRNDEMEDVEGVSSIFISVTDTGIGIRKENIGALFTPFSQVDSSATRRFKGTGLGLYISKQLVEMMDSELLVSSDFGHGSEFSFKLKLKHAIDDEKHDVSKQVAKKHLLSGLKVLIVEDNDLNTSMLQKIIGNENGVAHNVWNGKEAVEVLREKIFDIILMDIEMPDMDGFEATRIIRQDLKLDTPIICLTAHALDNDKKRFIDAGMNDYLSKPIIKGDLLQAIIHLVDK